jgi:hypothetical protein
MKLFKMDIVRRRRGKELIAHAPSELAAKAHVARKFPGWTIEHCVHISRAAHFVIADLVDG